MVTRVYGRYFKVGRVERESYLVDAVDLIQHSIRSVVKNVLDNPVTLNLVRRLRTRRKWNLSFF